MNQVAVLLACAAALASTAAGAGPVIRTESGLVEGATDRGAVVFKGIPFAAPPVGALRWRAPEAAAPWSGVRAGDRFAPTCLQRAAYPEGSPPEPMSEDCLYLNVWVPAGASAPAALPVLVWVHGGGLLDGSGSNPLYAGDEFARRDVILVTFNYRLGALGFLAHPWLSAESPHHVSGNYGHLDQLAALAWVQRNIAAFGGDPANVTVFGQSSGAISISAMVASPLARGLFRRAIGQSGGLFEPLDAAPEFSLAGAEQVGAAFVERLGAASPDALRALPATEVAAKRFVPVTAIDGHFLLETPYRTFADGRQNAVDLLAGSNAAEGLYFAAGRDIGAANLLDELQRDFPPFIVSLVGPGAPADDAAARAAFVAFEGDMRFGWDMWAWARLQARSEKGRTYFYRFAHVPPGAAGATHGAEMAYVFGHTGDGSDAGSAKERQLAETMMSYWTHFARTGDPNGAGLPVWPEYTPSGASTLLIGDEIRAGDLPGEAALESIDRLYGAVRIILEHGLAIGVVLLLLVVAMAWKLLAVFRRRPA